MNKPYIKVQIPEQKCKTIKQKIRECKYNVTKLPVKYNSFSPLITFYFQISTFHFITENLETKI